MEWSAVGYCYGEVRLDRVEDSVTKWHEVQWGGIMRSDIR